MRNVFLSLVVLFSLAVTLNSCGIGEKNSELLTSHVWVVTDVENDPPLSGEEEEAFKESKAHIIGTGTVTFKDDGTYIYDVMGPTEEGTWEMYPDGKSLKMTPNSGVGSSDAYIKKVSDSELTMAFGVISVMRIHFKAQ